MPEPILFYDIPRSIQAPGDNATWSPNTWKTRYCLNIKGLAYETVWVEFPDIEQLSKKIGAPPVSTRSDGSPVYTLPAIYDPNTKTAVADSAAIARYLDKTYPDTPTLIPPETDALHAAFQAAFELVIFPGRALDMVAILIPATHDALNPASQTYFRETREARFGKLSELAPPGTERRARHWAGVQKAHHTVAEWLEAGGKDQLFFLGEKISYADISIAGFLIWIRLLYGEGSQEWQDVLAWDGGRWEKFMEAFKKYEAVDVGSNFKP